jgi:hypothetical protein
MKVLIKGFRQKAAPIRSLQAFETSDFLRVLAGVWADRYSVRLWSHLPDSLFQRWLSSVCAALNPGGYLMFSTHGGTAATIDPSIYDSTIVLQP